MHLCTYALLTLTFWRNLRQKGYIIYIIYYNIYNIKLLLNNFLFSPYTIQLRN